MRIADGLLLVVDVLEGVMTVTERAIQQAVQEGLAITLLISKVSTSSEELLPACPEWFEPCLGQVVYNGCILGGKCCTV